MIIVNSLPALEPNKGALYKIEGPHSGVAEGWSLLACDTLSLGSRWQHLKNNITISYMVYLLTRKFIKVTVV